MTKKKGLLSLALALELARRFIQNKLQEMAMTHLYVRTQSNSVIIYSTERNMEFIRAILTQAPANEFMLSIANHRGQWQLIPFVGLLSEMVDSLTEELVFILARWNDDVPHV